MVSRRKFLATLPAASIYASAAANAQVSATPQASPAKAPSKTRPNTVSEHVKLRIGTGGHGHTFPGPTVPFGMVQLSPDTFNDGWDHCSGYHYTDESIMGFSHTHLSGTGCGDMLDILVMPCTGWTYTEPSSLFTPERGYRSRYTHEEETAVPGYYSVMLRDYHIRAELSATTRAGIQRYTFPKSDTSHIIVDLAHGYGQDEKNPCASWSEVRIVGNDTIVGARKVDRWAPQREIYFAMKFSKPFDRADIFASGKKLASGTTETGDLSTKCVLHYQTKAGETILVKTALSGVSIEGAQANLAAEIPGWDFEGVRHQAASAWERELSRIQVEGGTARQKEIFYTGLYHAFVAPTIFDDVDGKYRGMDGAVHTLAKGEHNYSTFSLWDTYRAAHPLYTIVQPERVPSMVNCLIRMSSESPAGLPIWPLQGKETYCMTGYHSVSVIAEAAVKGFKGLDLRSGYAVMRKRMFDEDFKDVPLYRKYGYVPADMYAESVSRGLDYAYDDWAVAHVARILGETQDAEALIKRAGSYRNYFDPGTKFMRAKLATGEFTAPFDPNEIRHMEKWIDYTESNAWQATFAVQHDPKGLAELMGGSSQLVAKLDDIFNADPTLPASAAPDIAGLVGQYAHGNEPSHHIAYLYVYGGAPYKTQERVASLMETMYDNLPAGLAGNEDCGQMSAWYILSAMGFYPVDPVSGVYVLGSPIFNKVTVSLPEGKRFVIEAKRTAAEDIYIHGGTLNGKPLNKAWFRHSDIVNGGTLTLQMSGTADKGFGSDPADAPPSRTA